MQSLVEHSDNRVCRTLQKSWTPREEENCEMLAVRYYRDRRKMFIYRKCYTIACNSRRAISGISDW